jgi:hypothetical protein
VYPAELSALKKNDTKSSADLLCLTLHQYFRKEIPCSWGQWRREWRMLYNSIHDLAQMLDRWLAEREVEPTGGVIDSLSVPVPVASAHGYGANKNIQCH